jgi:hypothetical protein
MNHDERDQQLEADYRRASEQDAGRPVSATRVAILAEAAAGAAARRRATSAANEPRYWMRAVAGVAGVGVGILLWRQTDHRLPGESTVMVVENQQLQEAAAPTAVADAAAPVAPAPAAEESALQAPPTGASRQAANAGAAAAEADAPATADLAREQRAAQPALAPPAVATESQQKAAAPQAADELEEVAVTAQFAAGATSGADSLLRQHFPSQYQSDSPHRLWLVRNAAGVVLQMGELAAGESRDDIAARLAGNPPDRRPGTWRTSTVTNARGQPIELSVGEIP